MTTSPTHSKHENGPVHEHASRLDPPAIDALAPAEDPAGPASEGRLRERLAPFVAWLATQNLDEPDRRRHRAAAERFLRWSRTDTGPAEDRRRRYEHHLLRHDPDHLHDAHAGLDWWTHHRRLLASTLPTDR